MIFIRIVCEGQGYRSRRQVTKQRFSTMTLQSLEVVAGGGRLGQRNQGCEVEAVAMDSGSTKSPQMELSFLSPLDMAALGCPMFIPSSGSRSHLIPSL